MSNLKRSPENPPAASERFLDTARKLGISATRRQFERVLGKVVPSKRRKRRRKSR